MSSKIKLGIITYDCPHLKTLELICRYKNNPSIGEIKVFALPYLLRKQRSPLFSHRPDMSVAPNLSTVMTSEKVTFQRWNGHEKIGQKCDFFIIGGAGIINPEFSEGKPVINGHPGIIPLTRGLDSFKWAIYNGDPLGVTIHKIDHEVDKGEILSFAYTPIFIDDTLQTLARRHYELEINMMSDIPKIINSRVQTCEKEKPSTLRMGIEVEKKMIANFEFWKTKMLEKKL